MAAEFLLPDPGEGIHEAEILEIHAKADDTVADGDVLFTVETDKAVIEIPAPFDGRIAEIPVSVGDIVEVGEVLLTYQSSDDGGADDAQPEPTGTKSHDAQPEPTGTKRQDDAAVMAATRSAGTNRPPVPASPATRKLARRLDIDLHEIEGSGPEGRITPDDVQTAADGERQRDSRDDVPADMDLPDFESHGSVDWVDVRGVRRATARQMSRAWERIPHVTHYDVADIERIEQMRRTVSEDEAAPKITMTAFLVKIAAMALMEHPRFNTSYDEANERLAIKHYLNIGVAVDTDEGLVVPVIRHVDGKSIAEIAEELSELADRMRSGDRSLEDFQGGSFTVTNPGGIGGTSLSPIINHPEVAILGAARAERVPVVNEDGDVVVRLRLPLALSFDHRINDGADAARFMNTVVELLEEPSRLLAQV